METGTAQRGDAGMKGKGGAGAPTDDVKVPKPRTESLQAQAGRLKPERDILEGAVEMLEKTRGAVSRTCLPPQDASQRLSALGGDDGRAGQAHRSVRKRQNRLREKWVAVRLPENLPGALRFITDSLFGSPS